MKIKQFCRLIDSKLSFTTDDENFEGILKFVLIAGERVTFEHVFELPSRAYLGTVHILFSAITSWSVIEPALQNFDVSPSLFHGQFDKTERIDNTELIKIASGSNFFQYLPSNLSKQCPSDCCVVDSLNPAFFEVVDLLSNSKFLGASFHGPKVSRTGSLTWVCISSSDRVFLFDIEQLGRKAFEKGLKSIFENDKIKKAIHDCREAADCLLHVFNTELKNVFDTQVADYLINMQIYNGEDFFKQVSALDSCLFKYLKVPQQFLYNRNKYAAFDEEMVFFRKRPVSQEFIDVLVKSSVYLVLLMEEQEKLLMSPYEQATDIVLNCVRSATDSEVHAALPDSSQFTQACLSESVKTIRFQNVRQPPDDFRKKMKENRHGNKTVQH